MRKIQKLIAVFLSALLCFSGVVLPAYAAKKDDVSATYDQNSLYIHAEKSSGVYNWYGMAVYSLEIKSSGGDLWLQLQPGDGQTLTVRNQTGYTVIDGSSGSYSYDSSGAGKWDIEIPLDALESHSAQTEIIVKMNWAGAGNVVKKAQPAETASSSSEEPDSSGSSGSASSDPVSEQPSGGDGGIVIDGYYDDWDSIPYTIFTYHGWNDTQNHKVSVVKDDANIYVHVKLSEHYYSQIPIDEMLFHIEGKGWIRVCLRYTDDPYNLSGIYFLEPGRHGELSPYLDVGSDGQWHDLGDAYVTIPEESNEDEMEYSINIKSLEQAMGWAEGTVNNSGKIITKMPNLGNQHVVVTGTSTAPLVGVAVSLTAVALVFVFRKYRRRKVQL